MKRFAVLFTLLACALSLKAQEVWTLEKCVEYALTNNLQVKQQDLLIRDSKANVLQSKLVMLPSLNGFAMHGYNYGKTVDRYTNQFATERVRSNNFYLSSQVTLFDGFQKLNQVKQNLAELEALRYDTDKFMDDISLGIATAYLQILYFREMNKIAASQVKATELQAARLRKLVDAGALAQGDYYAIQAQLAAENVTLVESRNNLDLSYLTLAQMLDLPSAEGFEIEEPDLDLGASPSLVANAEQVYEFALQNQPSIKSAESRVKSAEIGMDLARGSLSPTLSLQGSLGTGYSGAAMIYDSTVIPELRLQPIGFTLLNGVPDEKVYQYTFDPVFISKPFSDQINDNINKSISFNLSVPIFNGWLSRTAISKAKIGAENSRLNLELQKQQLRKTIQQAYADAKAALNTFQSAKAGVEAGGEAFRYAEQKFTVGLMNSVDYNNAKKDLEKAESQLLQAKYDFIFKSTVLEFYMGNPISLNRK